VTEVEATVQIEASLAETWDRHFDQRGWPAWVDGFDSVISSAGYPEAGGTLRWKSTPAGRGEVTETVLSHEPRRLHRIAFVDPQSEGELTTSFQIQGEGTSISQKLSYKLRGGGLFGWASDKLFIRPQQRGSMQRSLLHLKREVERNNSAASSQRAVGDR
jgi:hypothetical protein